MNKSDDISALATALCLAQSEFENAKKTSKNPFFNSKYASLEEVLATVKPILNEHDISILQFPSLQGGSVYVETVLLHKSGQWISEDSGTEVPKVPTDKQLKELMPLATTEATAIALMRELCTADAQLVGKAISYLRRYSLLSVCGIAQEDDDGESLAGRTEKKAQPTVEPKRYMKMIELVALKKVPQTMQNLWLTKAGVASLDKLSSEQVEAIIKMLEKE